MLESGRVIDIGKDLQDAFDDGYEKAMQDRWISVSEILPNEAGAYLVFNNMDIVRKLDIEDYHSEVEIMYFSLKHKKFNTNSIVIAWQPLPGPYKE